MITFHVAQSDLTHAFALAVRAIDCESSRFALGAVRIERVDGNRMAVVGTDGRRMHIAYVDIIGGDSEPFEALIPAATARKLAKLPTSGKRQAMVDLEPSILRAVFSVGRGRKAAKPERIECVLAEGHYPRWADVIPNRNHEPGQTITGQASDLAELWERPQGVTLTLNGSIARTMSRELVSENHWADDKTCRWERRQRKTSVRWSGEATFCFDPDYMLDYLTAFEDEAPLSISLDGSDNAAVLSNASGSRKAVIMPLSMNR